MNLLDPNAECNGLKLTKKDLLPFGKYKGMTVSEASEIDSEYLRWLADNTDLNFHPEVLKGLDQEALPNYISPYQYFDELPF